jgi:hypothetical protein
MRARSEGLTGEKTPESPKIQDSKNVVNNTQHFK